MIEDFPEHLRPYTDEQIPAAMQRIAAHRYFPDVAAMIFPGITPAEAIRKVLEVKTVHQFQMEWMYAFNKRVIDYTMESFTYHFSPGISTISIRSLSGLRPIRCWIGIVTSTDPLSKKTTLGPV